MPAPAAHSTPTAERASALRAQLPGWVTGRGFRVGRFWAEGGVYGSLVGGTSRVGVGGGCFPMADVQGKLMEAKIRIQHV